MLEAVDRGATGARGCDPVPALKALAHPLRFSLFELLASGEKCVCDLVEAMDASQPLVSHHLAVLKKARLVRDRQDATWNYYSVDAERWNEVREALSSIRPSELPSVPCPPEDTCC
jgi:ArsR family transcriptional regulator, arsenate/arsenite/antimonite-responsive transcriptional repressor